MAPATDTLEVTLETQIDDVEYWERLFEMHPASVTVSRTSDKDVKQRQLVVHLDGDRLGDLLFGGSISQDLAPGLHRLRISNTLIWKTVTFEVHPGEQVRFEAINRAGVLTYPLLLILGAAPLYLTVKRVS